MPVRKSTPAFRQYILDQYHNGVKPKDIEANFGLTSGQVCKWDWMQRNDYRASKQLRRDLEECGTENENLRKDNDAMRSAIHRLTRKN